VQDDEDKEQPSSEEIVHGSLKKALPRLPAQCVRFSTQNVYEKPSDLVKDLVAALPPKQRLNEDQDCFIQRFAEVLDTVYAQENTTAPEKRHVYHMLLLGQGGSGKTHIVQNIVFPVVHFIWPSEGEQSTLMVVAAKNAQAKNISTDTVRAKTLHSASLLGVQSLTNSNMAAGSNEKGLQKLWSSVRVLVVEEISMVSALLYNMLDFRAMLGRRLVFGVDPNTYAKTGCAFGRVPIVLHLGDFFQLRPTAQLSLLDDLMAQDEHGNWKHADVPAEVQHAQKVFAEIPDVFELRGTMRFKPGDPLIDLLQCMRQGHRLPDAIWNAFQQRCARNTTSGNPDERFNLPRFRRGYCMSIYWASLVRMMYRRALLDAAQADQPLVLVQAADNASGLERDVAFRFLNRPNPYQTGHMHGLFPCHVGMRIRLVAKLDADKGMVQDTLATIMDFEFHSTDRARYRQCKGGELFSPEYLPSGLWVAVDGYQGCSGYEDLLARCTAHIENYQEAERLAKSFWFLPAEEVVIQLNSSQKYDVRRCGFRITHANFFTSTGSQGLTLREGTIIDCARLPEMDDENWWLHLYVMFSRVTTMDDMLLLRAPPREILELGPPAAIRTKVAQFQERAKICRAGVAARFGHGA
jgi:hypothetical protein